MKVKLNEVEKTGVLSPEDLESQRLNTTVKFRKLIEEFKSLVKSKSQDVTIKLIIELGCFNIYDYDYANNDLNEAHQMKPNSNSEETEEVGYKMFLLNKVRIDYSFEYPDAKGRLEEFSSGVDIVKIEGSSDYYNVVGDIDLPSKPENLFYNMKVNRVPAMLVIELLNAFSQHIDIPDHIENALFFCADGLEETYELGKIENSQWVENYINNNTIRMIHSQKNKYLKVQKLLHLFDYSKTKDIVIKLGMANSSGQSTIPSSQYTKTNWNLEDAIYFMMSDNQFAGKDFYTFDGEYTVEIDYQALKKMKEKEEL